MEKSLIKTWLLNKKPRVYSIIVQSYFDKLSSLRTALFIEWLALELDLPVELINKSSISSALRRYRKRINDKEGTIRKRSTEKNRGEFDTYIPEKISFQ